MRAASPELDGFVESDGVRTHYEVYGDGGPTILMIPPSPITHARAWKGQIPFLARRHRVVTFDGRGSGLSDKPTAVDDYAPQRYVGDAWAVLDALGVERCVLVTHCHSAYWGLLMATGRADLIAGWVAISPGVPFVGKPNPNYQRAENTWADQPVSPTGWEMLNPSFWRGGGYGQWFEFFFSQTLPEPHSTKQHEDMVAWALEVPVESMVAAESVSGPLPSLQEMSAALSSVRCPVLVIHGTDDRCQSIERGRAVAELTGGELVEIDEGGHIPGGREPVKVNLAIEEFVEHTQGDTMTHRTWSRGLNRRKRVLYVSSPIGLGHARRDVAVAKELKRLEPDIEIDWLAQDPVTRVLQSEGETIHPASRWLASESQHFVSEASDHDLNAFQALRRMDEILVANFMVFQEVVEEGLYDLVVGDEAWDIDHFWHENPELKRGSHVWFTDFVGFLPMPESGEHEAYLTADYNAEMIEHIARYPRIRDRAIFVGSPDDVIQESFGPDLPKIKDWTEEHFDFSGYITGFTPPDEDAIGQMRHSLGFEEGETVAVVTVGGSGVGGALLNKVIDAFPMARDRIPGLRMIVVTGPRIDPTSFATHDGLEIHGYVDRLYRHLSACDLALVQGGLTTTMELAAARRPFLYFPLRNHFEQNFHVRHRLDRYRAGRHMSYEATNPDALAEAIVNEITRPVDYLPVETDGAARAASMIAELV
jgi:pimeloyl-ACP methyl ester carboxylesterase/predicted glycosyltransferase